MMRDVLSEAERCYNEGNHVQVMRLLGPLASSGKKLDVPSMVRLAVSYTRLQQFGRAVDLFLQAEAADPARGLVFLKMALNLSGKMDNPAQTLDLARRVLALDPTFVEARRHYRHLLRRSFNYAEIARSDRETLEGLRASREDMIEAELPHDLIMWCAEEEIFAKLETRSAQKHDPTSTLQRRRLPHSSGGRIRIGYFTADLSEYHATLCLMNRMFDLHDTSRFDVQIYDFSPDEYVDNAQGFRLRNAARIHRVHPLQSDDLIDYVRGQKLDIAIDLKGHTENARVDLFNRGLAPVQVAYLGFPGPGTGIDCDYIICDPVVCPPESQRFYEEKFCWMPDSYQVNDNHYRHVSTPMTKAEAGLPEDRLVFMSANHPRKISLETIDLWARVLTAVPEGVLWIVCDQEHARSSLTAVFGERGIAADRLLFAGRVGLGEHYGRLGAGDIGLDTFPCNGHTTTSDKLWSGLPLITKKGRNFASRVSESLLRAVGHGELVAEDADGFVDLCKALARDPERRAAIRNNLLTNRSQLPLFDTGRFVRHLESAFTTMVERSRNGLAPEQISVAAID